MGDSKRTKTIHSQSMYGYSVNLDEPTEIPRTSHPMGRRSIKKMLKVVQIKVMI